MSRREGKRLADVARQKAHAYPGSTDLYSLVAHVYGSSFLIAGQARSPGQAAGHTRWSESVIRSPRPSASERAHRRPGSEQVAAVGDEEGCETWELRAGLRRRHWLLDGGAKDTEGSRPASQNHRRRRGPAASISQQSGSACWPSSSWQSDTRIGHSPLNRHAAPTAGTAKTASTRSAEKYRRSESFPATTIEPTTPPLGSSSLAYLTLGVKPDPTGASGGETHSDPKGCSCEYSVHTFPWCR